MGKTEKDHSPAKLTNLHYGMENWIRNIKSGKKYDISLKKNVILLQGEKKKHSAGTSCWSEFQTDKLRGGN